MLETIHMNNFLSKSEVDEIVSAHTLYNKLLKEEYIKTDKHVHLVQFQTSGFWFLDDLDLDRSPHFDWNKVHTEYKIDDDWIMPDKKPEFLQFLQDIKPQLNVEDFHNHLFDLLNKKLSEVVSDHGELYWCALYDIPYNFELHCDGRDVKRKRDPRPDNWDDLTYEDWHHEDNVEYTRQGLINLDVHDSHDGTCIFDQSFPYSMYVDFSKLPDEFPILKKQKPKLKFAKGDSIERYGAKIEKFTHKEFDPDDYDYIMENCIDESVWPIEAGYGLSLEQILTFDTPGTMYSWDTTKFHKTRPFTEKFQFDEIRRRLSIAFTCGRFT